MCLNHKGYFKSTHAAFRDHLPVVQELYTHGVTCAISTMKMVVIARDLDVITKIKANRMAIFFR